MAELPIDPSTIDPRTMEAGAETNILIASEWMGWTLVRDSLDNRLTVYTVNPAGIVTVGGKRSWSPTTNAAHAGEAMVKAESSGLWQDGPLERIVAWIDDRDNTGTCNLSETNGDKGEAMALAICRAIAAALQAKENG